MLKPKPKQLNLPMFGVLAVVVFTLLSSIFVALKQNQETAYAATNGTVNFQARLMTNAGGIVADGDYNVEFKLFNASAIDGGETPIQGSCTTNPGAATDEDCLWTETRISGNKVTVRNGYLTVNLGSVTSFPATINWDQDLWMTMRVGGTGSPSWDAEMSPRLKLTAVPYAFRAGALSYLSGANTAVLQFAATIGQGTVVTLPDPGSGTATVCYQNASACGFAVGTAGSYIQNGTSQQTAANFNIVSAATGSITALMQGMASSTVPVTVIRSGATPGAGADLLSLQNFNGSTVYAKFDKDGLATLKGVTISDTTNANAFNIQDANGTFVLADPVNQKFWIGSQALCGGRLCVGNTISAAGGATYTNALNSTDATISTTASTFIGQEIDIVDHSTVVNTLKGLIIDASASTATSVFQGIQVKAASGTTVGNSLLLQNGSTNIFKVTNTGSVTLQTTNSVAAAFEVNNSSARNVFRVSTNGNYVAVGNITTTSGAGVAGDIRIADGSISGRYFSIVTAGSIGQNTVITLPDPASGTATFCYQSATACGFAPGTNGSYIQNQSASAQTSSSFWISGTGIATTLQAATLETPSGTTTLAIGTNNTTTINLNQNTAIASGKTLAVNGDVTFKASASGGSATAFQVQTFSSTPVFTVTNSGGATNPTVYIGPTLDSNAKLYIETGLTALKIKQTGTSNTNPLLQLLSSNSGSALDAFKVGADGDVTLGSNTNKTIAVAAAASGNNGNTLTIQAGNGTGTTKNGGNLILQGGNLTSGGTAGSVIVKPQSNTAAAFLVQNAAGTTTVLNVDTTNNRVGVGAASGFSMFEVNGGDAAVYNSGANARIILGDSSTSGQYGWLQWDSTNDYFRIETVGSNGLKINDNNLSIGNIFPSQPLIVASGSTNLFQVASTGITTATATNATAFVVQNTSSNATFTVDTSGAQIILGKASTINGAILFQNSTNANTVGVISGVTSASYTLTLPTAVGASGDCLKASNGTGALTFGSCASGPTALVPVPTTTATNTVQPTAASVVAMTLNGTSSVGNPAQALIINQAFASADAANINLTNTSGTQTNALLINRNGASGTTTNALAITNTAGTLTTGVAFTGTIGTDIQRTTGTLTIQGAAVSITSPDSTSANTGAITIQSGSATVGSNLNAGTVTIDTGTRTGIGTATLNLGRTNAVTLNLGSTSSALTIDSTNFRLTSAGVISGATGLSSSGTIAFGGLSTNGAVYTSGGNGTLNSEANLSVSRGGSGAGTFSGNAVLLGNGTSAFQVVAPGSNGNILTSNGTTWTSAAPAAGCAACLAQVPGTTAQNTVTPTANSVVGLTVNGTSGTAATAAIINQSLAADGANINLTNTSGTQVNGLEIERNGASGTTTNGLAITNTAGTLTNGLAFTGTIGTDITRGSGTLTIQGNGGINLTSGGNITLGVSDTTGTLLVLDTDTDATEATPVNGGMYYNSSMSSFRCGQAGVWVNCIGGLLSSNTAASAAITNTTTETNFDKTFSLPANYCVAGRVIRWTAYGVVTGVTSTSLQLKIKAGSTSLGTGPSSTIGTTANMLWRLEGQMICNAAPSASSAVEAQSYVQLFTGTATASNYQLGNSATINLATNGALTLQISAQWGTANAATITMRQFIIEGL